MSFELWAMSNWKLKVEKCSMLKARCSLQKIKIMKNFDIYDDELRYSRHDEIEKNYSLREELRTWAIPSTEESPLIASTWFFIKAIKGETTIAVPSEIKAGSW